MSSETMRPVTVRCSGHDGTQRCSQKFTGELIEGFSEDVISRMIQHLGWRYLHGLGYCPIHAPLPDLKGACWELKEHLPHTIYQAVQSRDRSSFGLRRCIGRLEDVYPDD
jgi:hypothetical protein